MTERKIYAVEQVLLVNRDISDLYEQRGVTREELREIFRLAAWMVSKQQGVPLEFYIPPKEVSDAKKNRR